MHPVRRIPSSAMPTRLGASGTGPRGLEFDQNQKFATLHGKKKRKEIADRGVTSASAIRAPICARMWTSRPHAVRACVFYKIRPIPIT